MHRMRGPAREVPAPRSLIHVTAAPFEEAQSRHACSYAAYSPRVIAVAAPSHCGASRHISTAAQWHSGAGAQRRSGTAQAEGRLSVRMVRGEISTASTPGDAGALAA